MKVDSEKLCADLAGIVGEDHLLPATRTDAVDGKAPQWVIAPGSASEVARILHIANETGLRVVPCGSRTKMTWGNPPQGIDLLLSTRRLNRVVEHTWGDMTATVEAGCTVADFQRVLRKHNQRLAVDPLWPEQATIGGMLATDESGALRLRFGSLRDMLIGVAIVLPDGTLAKSGGKVLKNVAGYDLPKLMIGAFGSLAVIVEAIFRLYPLPHSVRTLTFAVPSPAAMNHLVLALLDSTLAPVSVQVRASSLETPQVDVHFEGRAEAIEVQTSQCVRLATMGQLVGTPPNVWQVGEALWDRDVQEELPALVCRVSLLSSHLQDLHKWLRQSGMSWQMVIQAFGVGLVRLEYRDEQGLLAALAQLRANLAKLDGSLVVLQCPFQLKEHIDVWGLWGESDALPLMRQVKERFDPRGTISSGRFIGGI